MTETRYDQHKSDLGGFINKAKDEATQLQRLWLADAISGDTASRAAATKAMVSYELIAKDLTTALERLVHHSRYAAEIEKRASGLTSAITELNRTLKRT